MKVHELFETVTVASLRGTSTSNEPFPGDFRLENTDVESLEGCPHEVTGTVWIRNNKKLTSLKGGPKIVGNDYIANNCSLVSVEGSPEKIDIDFMVHNNNIESLEGCPKFVGCDFWIHTNNLSNLHNIHKQIKHIGGMANFGGNPITSHMLGLLLIDGLCGIYYDNKKIENIINKHLKGERDIFACQEELIEAGFEDFAQL